ncbi:glycosyltransferase [uncultured Corynebacterium sp.]|uniref:glycosyltransferase family protein n=1 Tax=uncultured Corynebacterium sp. TaxID=159447 RepID=UPI0025CC49F8|nr:glycosyltransferase [uncultured Corynebacterium sp.]
MICTKKRSLNPIKSVGKKVLTRRQIEQAKDAVAQAKSLLGKRVRYPDVYETLSPTVAPSFDVTVGVIFDEFSLRAWEPEFRIVELTPGQWQSALEGIDLLFVESAWAGNGGAWQYQLTGSNAPSSELRALVSACQERGIPTAFWNKEDPPHFEDFLDTATLFDYVFTTDANKIPDYRERTGNNRIFALPFAAQPTIHNPIRPKAWEKRLDIAFAGTYFAHKFASRRQQMDLLLGAADELHKDRGVIFDIYSRHYRGDAKYQFPGSLKKRVVGSLPYSQMLSAYKDYKIFLNVNSVTDSPTMCARRVFELLACGTPVVTTRSTAIDNFFTPQEIFSVDSREDALRWLSALLTSPALGHKALHRAQRKIWDEHTYRARAQYIFDTVGLADATGVAGPRVSIISSSNRPEQIDHLISQIAHQSYGNVEVLYLAHGFDPAGFEEKFRAAGITDVRIMQRSTETALGECLNVLVDASTGDYLAKFDDDDYYLEEYLSDLVNAANFSGADILGKAAIYFYLEGTNTLSLRWPHKEHTWYHFVAGATFFCKAEVMKALKFRELGPGEDSDFLRRANAAGYSIYSSDRFNYIAARRADTAGAQTWTITDAQILSHSPVETFGLHLDHVRA